MERQDECKVLHTRRNILAKSALIQNLLLPLKKCILESASVVPNVTSTKFAVF